MGGWGPSTRPPGHEVGNEDDGGGVAALVDASDSSTEDDADSVVLAESQDAAGGSIVPHTEATAADRAAAEDFEAGMARFRAMRELAEQSQLPHLVEHIQKEEVHLRKRQRLATPGAQQLMARWLRDKAAQTRLDLEHIRKAADAERAAETEEKRLANVEAAKKKLEAEAQAKREALMAVARLRLPVGYSLEDLGQGQRWGGLATHHNNRMAALNRLKDRAPPLPVDLEAAWPNFVHQYSNHMKTEKGEVVGAWWVAQRESVLSALGPYAVEVPGARRLGGAPVPLLGNPEGFSNWMRKALGALPKARLML